MTLAEILAQYGLDAGVIGVVALIVLKWKQVAINAGDIKNIKEEFKSIHSKLDNIQDDVSETKGWIKGFKNGKRG